MSLKKKTDIRSTPFFYSIIKFRKKDVWVNDAWGGEESISKAPSPVRRCTLIFQDITMETHDDCGGSIPLSPRVDTPRGQLFWLMSSEAGAAFCTRLLKVKQHRNDYFWTNQKKNGTFNNYYFKIGFGNTYYFPLKVIIMDLGNIISIKQLNRH